MQVRSFKARDGLDIPAYLTMPPGAAPGAAPGAKPPLVVLAHGGPASRDDYAFDFIVQFLASRGYAVLQPQFRGSTGFGKALEEAGRGEWGGKVQTDLLDGIASMAAAGMIDPARVCIVGASFGGYTALAGATLHPEAYRCAASIAGMSDLGQMINDEAGCTGATPRGSNSCAPPGRGIVRADRGDLAGPTRRGGARTGAADSRRQGHHRSDRPVQAHG